MNLIDSHIHLFDERFNNDRDEVVGRALKCKINKLLIPATDTETHHKVVETVKTYPGICYGMMGLHPTSVNNNPGYRRDLEIVDRYLKDSPIPFIAIGEIGLDLYWSREYQKEQEDALRFQLDLVAEYDLPVSIHVRDAFQEIFRVLEDYESLCLNGVFHSFSGSIEDYHKIKTLGNYKVGISGPVTYKNSNLPDVIEKIPIEDILLETDAPYLPPVPYRGKRNESSYIPLIAEKIAMIKNISVEEVAEVTTYNVKKLFPVIA